MNSFKEILIFFFIINTQIILSIDDLLFEKLHKHYIAPFFKETKAGLINLTKKPLKKENLKYSIPISIIAMGVLSYGANLIKFQYTKNQLHNAIIAMRSPLEKANMGNELTDDQKEKLIKKLEEKKLFSPSHMYSQIDILKAKSKEDALTRANNTLEKIKEYMHELEAETKNQNKDDDKTANLGIYSQLYGIVENRFYNLREFIDNNTILFKKFYEKIIRGIEYIKMIPTKIFSKKNKKLGNIKKNESHEISSNQLKILVDEKAGKIMNLVQRTNKIDLLEEEDETEQAKDILTLYFRTQEAESKLEKLLAVKENLTKEHIINMLNSSPKIKKNSPQLRKR